MVELRPVEGALRNANTRVRAKRHVSLGVEATLTDREPPATCQLRAGGMSRVQRAPERAPVPTPESTSVERVLRRTRAREPAPRETLSLEVEAVLRELHENVF